MLRIGRERKKDKEKYKGHIYSRNTTEQGTNSCINCIYQIDRDTFELQQQTIAGNKLDGI